MHWSRRFHEHRDGTMQSLHIMTYVRTAPCRESRLGTASIMTMEYFVHGPSSHELRFRKFARGHLITARLAIDRDHWLAINNRRRREPVEFPDREFHFRITNDRRRHQRIRSALRLGVQCLQWMISDLYRAKYIYIDYTTYLV